MQKKNKSQKKLNKLSFSTKEKTRKNITMILVFSLFFSLFIYNTSLSPVQDKSEIVEFEVQEGMYFSEIVDALHKEELINSVWATKLYARLSKNQSIAAGLYQIDRSWSTKEILEYLTSTVPYRDITVKFDEASWAKDIALALESSMGFSSDELISLWNDETYVRTLIEDFEYLDQRILENKDQKRVLLEGFLYPDTYRFAEGSSMDTVTRRILQNFDDKMRSIDDLIQASDFDVYDLVTLSSIVMYEAATQDDQQMVSGVFMNRLNIKMPLQSSVTVCYVLYDFESWVDCEKYRNQEIESPYNTYMIPGLPVGPILNPSIFAIENTLRYKEHDYLFFIADVYEGGDGTVYYSKTYQEHLNKEKELKNR